MVEQFVVVHPEDEDDVGGGDVDINDSEEMIVVEDEEPQV